MYSGPSSNPLFASLSSASLTACFVSPATDALGVVAPDEGLRAFVLGVEAEAEALELVFGLGEAEDALKFGEGLKLAR